MSSPGLELRFVTSAARVEDLPDSRAEVAVVGRSNVGKSTLVNALARRRQLARTSSTPGRTRLLNVFATDDGATLVDLPGYGYAKGARGERTQWERRQSLYLSTRTALRCTLLLVDGVIGPARLDVEMLAWLRAHDLEFVVVATKHDKVKSSQRVRRRRDLARGCGVAEDEVRWVSAEKGTGMDGLRVEVRARLA